MNVTNVYDPVVLKAVEGLRLKNSGGQVKVPASVLEWAKRYRRIDGQPFSLTNFQPLEALYQDDFPKKVVMKPAQRGVSEYAISLTCFALEYGSRVWGKRGGGLNVGYIFPVQQALNDFSKERISSLREESIHLAQLFSDDEFDSLGFKKVGSSYLYLRGGWSIHALLTFPADVLILDEYDRMDPHAIALARRRMNASRIRREVAISTPTIPGMGIHEAFMHSDQRTYKTPCGSCGKEWSYNFFESVYLDGEPYDVWREWNRDRADTGEVTLVCPACKAVQTDEQRCAPGRWEIGRPEAKGVHGYHIPWWPWEFLDLRGLIQSALSDKPEEVQELYRSDLGLPYTSSGSMVSEDMLIQLTTHMPEGGNGEWPQGMRWRDTVMGVDIGSRNHYRVTSIDAETGRICVRTMGSVKGWESLDQLMVRYQVRLCIVDELPELDASEKFCLRWKGRALRATYPSQTNALQGMLCNQKKGTSVIQINRTMAMDRVHAAVAVASEVWPVSIARDPEVVAHMTAPVRVATTDQHGQERHDWVHTKPDHLFHACVYSVVARAVLPQPVSGDVAVGGERGLLTAYQRAIGASEILPTSRHGRLAMPDPMRY